VHLCSWPQAGHVNELVIKHMSELRAGIEQGLSKRAAERIKVRQPLQSVVLYLSGLPPDDALLAHYRQIIGEELNVKEVVLKDASLLGTDAKVYPIELDTDITSLLRREGIAREVIRHIQNERKKAQLQVDDRILLNLSTTDDELKESIIEHADTISNETLAKQLVFDQSYLFSNDVVIDGMPLTLSFQKAQ
jgi:isoleucyl-tRNA synthetase